MDLYIRYKNFSLIFNLFYSQKNRYEKKHFQSIGCYMIKYQKYNS